MKKLFILDTNVILHDHTSIFHFDEHDVIIPIVVLEELDKFKRGNDTINLSARAFIRELNNLTDNSPVGQQIISLGDGKGNLIIKTDGFARTSDNPIFDVESNDNKILILAYNMTFTINTEDTQVILVTKDINLRMKARALGLNSQDYETGKIQNLDQLYQGYRMIEDVDPTYIDRLHSESLGIHNEYVDSPLPNEYYIFRNGKQSLLARYNSTTKLIEKLLDNDAANIKPRNVEQTFAINALLNPEIPLVTLTGKAGTGKTLLALASAIAQRKSYTQVFLGRPVVPLGNDIGFLPGDIKAKLDPYMAPLWDNLAVVKKAAKTPKTIEDMIANEKILIAPLPYIRGRSLPNVFFIVDEAQNLTPHEIKTIVTRIGEDSKIVFTGDLYQIDTPYLDSRSNGLSYLIHKMKGQHLFAHVNLCKGERSTLAELASNVL